MDYDDDQDDDMAFLDRLLGPEDVAQQVLAQYGKPKKKPAPQLTTPMIGGPTQPVAQAPQAFAATPGSPMIDTNGASVSAPGASGDFDALADAPPGDIDSILGLGQLGDRDRQIQQQMARVEALRRPYQGAGDTTTGAFWGGLANALGGIKAGRREEELQKQRSGLLDQEKAALKARLALERRRRNGQPPPTDDQLEQLLRGSANNDLSGGSAGAGDVIPDLNFGYS